jgi:hypothetical protein
VPLQRDGTARVWDAESSAKVIEVHADPRATTRAHSAAVSPDGSHICLGCNDGGGPCTRCTQLTHSSKAPSSYSVNNTLEPMK